MTNGAGSSIPPIGDRSTLIEDNLLSTGIINPTDSALGNTAALDFTAPVTNSVGVDIIFFEVGTNGNQGDEFIVSINGVTQAINFDTQIYADGVATQQIQTSDNGNVTSLTELENDPFTATGTISQGLYAYSLDLSDFGVAFGDTITSMSFSSSPSGQRADPTFFGALPIVPEPSAYASLVGILALITVASRRRRQA